jgi:hypothetical protein
MSKEKETPPVSSKVFVVHGHDDGFKQEVARVIEKLGLEAIILHEQPNGGKTVIEKFEHHTLDVAFVVALLTPDDIAHVRTASPEEAKGRARQNVILELGYFVGKLGRSKVLPLVKGEVEIPSDFAGIVYTPYDNAWQYKLVQELDAAGIAVDANALLGRSLPKARTVAQHPASRQPTIRLGDSFICETNERDRNGIYRVRVFNDGQSKRAAKVYVAKMLYEDGEPVVQDAMVPCPVHWSHHDITDFLTIVPGADGELAGVFHCDFQGEGGRLRIMKTHHTRESVDVKNIPDAKIWVLLRVKSPEGTECEEWYSLEPIRHGYKTQKEPWPTAVELRARGFIVEEGHE